MIFTEIMRGDRLQCAQQPIRWLVSSIAKAGGVVRSQGLGQHLVIQEQRRRGASVATRRNKSGDAENQFEQESLQLHSGGSTKPFWKSNGVSASTLFITCGRLN